ncbi:hypothetical protein V8C42DRAFT_210681 [Trichoderma barbatum]
MPQISSKPACLALESGTPSVERAALLSAENRDLCRAARASKHSPLLRALLVLAPVGTALVLVLCYDQYSTYRTNQGDLETGAAPRNPAVPLFGRQAAVISQLSAVGRTLPLLQNTARRPQKDQPLGATQIRILSRCRRRNPMANGRVLPASWKGEGPEWKWTRPDMLRQDCHASSTMLYCCYKHRPCRHDPTPPARRLQLPSASSLCLIVLRTPPGPYLYMAFAARVCSSGATSPAHYCHPPHGSDVSLMLAWDG